MNLHHVQSKIKKSSRKRIGRGGKRGTYSGRGQKGQKSRAGRRIRKAERDLILRLPKKRGFKNKPTGPKALVINLNELLTKLRYLLSQKDRAFAVDRGVLEEVGILPRGYRGEIKVLGGGAINVSITLKGLKVSGAAKNKIEKAGGKVE